MGDGIDHSSINPSLPFLRIATSIPIFSSGQVAEWSIAAVLKTAGPQGPVGSNPTLSANHLDYATALA